MYSKASLTTQIILHFVTFNVTFLSYLWRGNLMLSTSHKLVVSPRAKNMGCSSSWSHTPGGPGGFIIMQLLMMMTIDEMATAIV